MACPGKAVRQQPPQSCDAADDMGPQGRAGRVPTQPQSCCGGLADRRRRAQLPGGLPGRRPRPAGAQEACGGQSGASASRTPPGAAICLRLPAPCCAARGTGLLLEEGGQVRC